MLDATTVTPQVAQASFRTLMSSFPTGVTVVTAIGADGVPKGLTCTSLTSVSLEPPMLLVCLDARSGTLSAIESAGSFAVNLLHARGQRAAELFASRTPDRFTRIPWRPSGMVGAPWLVEDAFAVAECVVESVRTAGDHVVVFGQITDIDLVSDVPLMYGHRRFSAWLPGPVPL
ncbi:flavin reductase family protein [Nonomuraea sp. NN258]|uniref:flavin reductase family protein n=1 Tax=Nonomuraea antri TaxID=2730852 RepID=UPI001568695D|nr:flavin reductase family protein [Nonomuraea antri]NRQ35157.1 flavin reductase family protein [Nonomuraea antri]